MNDLSKLPKWAQHEITRLRGDLARARRDALAATSENARGTNVAISVDGGLTMRGLPPNATVRFTLEDGEIEVHHPGAQDPDGMLTVYCRTGRLLVLPSSSNVVHLRPETR